MGKIGPHQMMGMAVQQFLADGVPVQALEQGGVLALDMGLEAPAAPGMGGRHGQADQAAADGAQAAIGPVDRQARAAPQARSVPVDAHRADDLVGHAENRRQGHQGEGAGVDRVPVMAWEQALFPAEHLDPQGGGAGLFPGFGGVLDPAFAGAVGGDRFQQHG